MQDFPDFMKRPANRIGRESQYTEGIEGYVYNGADESQMAFWTCYQDRNSKEHTMSTTNTLSLSMDNIRLLLTVRKSRFTREKNAISRKAHRMPESPSPAPVLSTALAGNVFSKIESFSVIPRENGNPGFLVFFVFFWMPAFAGMTILFDLIG